MSKVLFIATANPFIRGGGSQATRAYLDSVIDIYGAENLTVMISEEDITHIEPEYSNLEFITVKRPSIVSFMVNYLCRNLHRFGRQLYKELKSGKYDVCIINGSLVAGWVLNRLNNTTVKLVVIHHNIEIEYHRDNQTKISLNGLFYKYIAWNEMKAYKLADLNLFLTKYDQSFMESHYGEHKGQNWWIGCYEYKKITKVAPKRDCQHDYTIVISGSLCDYQTIHGIKNFCSLYLKYALDIFYDLKILVAGRRPSDNMLSLLGNSDCFKVIANPDDIYNYVSQAQIYLCPTDVGGGIKLRVMDGLKCGKPVLVHAVSARGYESFVGKPYFQIYSDVDSFTRGLITIKDYLSSKSNTEEEIVNDYYTTFSYESGLQRMATIIQLLNY